MNFVCLKMMADAWINGVDLVNESKNWDISKQWNGMKYNLIHEKDSYQIMEWEISML